MEFNFESDFIIEGAPTPRTDRHMLGGVVKVDGVPAKKRVVLFEKATHTPVASTMSNPETGEWKITNISQYPIKGLFAVTFDDTEEFNAEIADFVTQVSEV